MDDSLLFSSLKLCYSHFATRLLQDTVPINFIILLEVRTQETRRSYKKHASRISAPTSNRNVFSHVLSNPTLSADSSSNLREFVFGTSNQGPAYIGTSFEPNPLRVGSVVPVPSFTTTEHNMLCCYPIKHAIWVSSNAGAAFLGDFQP